MHPFCQLLLKAIRVDSPPFNEPGHVEQSHANGPSPEAWEKTLWNLEGGLTKPAKKFWPALTRLVGNFSVP